MKSTILFATTYFPLLITNDSCLKNISSISIKKILNILELVQHTSIMQHQDFLLNKIVATLKRAVVDEKVVIERKHSLYKTLLYCLNVLDRPNVQISSTLWEVISSDLTWQERYMLYSNAWEWGSGNIRTLQSQLLNEYNDVSNVLQCHSTSIKPISVIASLITTSYKASHVLKRTSSENINSMAPMLAREAALISPLSAIKVLINIVGNYENMGELMIVGMQFWGDLGRDVVGYEMRWRLVNSKNTGTQVGFQSFLSSFYRDYSDVEINGILEFLYKDVGDGNIENIEILRGLLSVVGG